MAMVGRYDQGNIQLQSGRSISDCAMLVGKPLTIREAIIKAIKQNHMTSSFESDS